ncbi:TPR repeat-containing protein [Pseudoduganella lurida]|uniref:TPR repeat-containing protein n=2 Tax=Pseudoduganella lurida TaxID=1036180 RepID=A0A562RK69_9BURK|nr:TPR repeat-containing protein [Pseudoduganella lurida]
MQALKKAERARQSGLQEEDIPGGTEAERDAARAGEASPGASTAPVPAAVPPAAVTGLELSLEPLEPLPPSSGDAASPGSAFSAATSVGTAAGTSAGPSPAPLANPSSSPIEPAREAVHDPVPPQARHEAPRTRPDPAAIPVTDARAAPRPPSAAPEAPRAPGAPDRRAMSRDPRPRRDATAGIDIARLRVYALGGVLAVIVIVFVWLYRQAVMGPGPGAGLPMVPMPPPSATGATSVGGAAGAPIVVAPVGPPYGPQATVAEQPVSVATTATPATAAPSPAPDAAATRAPDTASATPLLANEPVRQSRAARRTAPVPRGPTPAQLAAIPDPEVRREAIRDAAERELRDMKQQAVETADAGTPAAAAPAVAGLAAAPLAAAGTLPGGEPGDMRMARGKPRQGVNPSVQAGYSALLAGDLASARQQYDAALRSDANNRDALLGTAALARREGRDADAADAYQRLLARDPRDADALAGMVALRPGEGDAAELRLKGALRNAPEGASLHFALGNLYARQRRWQEAQQAYFHAWSAAPGNPDYAFNLAIGLDHMNQGRLAREYYQRALALSGGQPAGFDRAMAERRLRELGGSAGAADAAPVVPTSAPGN